MQTIIKRQALEYERKDRVFDPKVRTIGVDKDALDAQLIEKSMLKQLEKDRDEFFNSQAVLMDQHAVFMAQQNEAVRTQKAKDLEAYWRRFHKTDNRREWDLNDPDGLRKDLPARVGDDDPRCGPSSAQRFHGEDLAQFERRKQQAQQIRDWNQQQLEEKRLREWTEQEDDRLFGERFEEQQQKLHAIENEVKTQRTAMNKATAEFNKALSQQKKVEKLREKRQDTLDSYEEIRNALDSDLLTENLESTFNVNDQNRFKRYHMKGLTPEHRQAILNEQAAQRQELQRRKEAAAEEERQWAVNAERTNALFGAVEAQLQGRRAAAMQNLVQDWNKQAADARVRNQTVQETYRNHIGNEYYDKFNTTSR